MHLGCSHARQVSSLQFYTCTRTKLSYQICQVCTRCKPVKCMPTNRKRSGLVASYKVRQSSCSLLICGEFAISASRPFAHFHEALLTWGNGANPDRFDWVLFVLKKAGQTSRRLDILIKHGFSCITTYHTPTHLHYRSRSGSEKLGNCLRRKYMDNNKFI